MLAYVEHKGTRFMVKLPDVSLGQLARALALGAGRCDTRGNELAHCRSCVAGSAQQYLDAAQTLRALFDQLAEGIDVETST
jgi:hypothetical protein